MNNIEKLIQQIRNQIGSEFISTDIVGIDGFSIAGITNPHVLGKQQEAAPVKSPTSSTPLPPLVWRGTDFSIKPEPVAKEVKKEIKTEIRDIPALFDSSDSSARFAAVMKLAANVSNKLEIGQVDDNLVTTDKIYVLSRFLGDGSYFWVLAVTRDATLGTIRMMMSEYAPQLWDAIPH